MKFLVVILAAAVRGHNFVKTLQPPKIIIPQEKIAEHTVNILRLSATH